MNTKQKERVNVTHFGVFGVFGIRCSPWMNHNPFLRIFCDVSVLHIWTGFHLISCHYLATISLMISRFTYSNASQQKDRSPTNEILQKWNCTETIEVFEVENKDFKKKNTIWFSRNKNEQRNAPLELFSFVYFVNCFIFFPHHFDI